MEVHVNYWAVLLSAIASMVIGMIWYAKPVFGSVWMKLAKMDAKKMQKGMAKSSILAFVLSLLTAIVIAFFAYVANHFFHHSFFQDSLESAFLLWAGAALTRTVTHDSFEQRPLLLTFLNVGNMFVTIMAMGAIIGWLKP